MKNPKITPSIESELFSILSTVLDVDNFGIIVVNAKGVVSFVNKSYAEFFGKKVEDMIGKFVDEAYANTNSAPSGLPRVLQSGKPEVGDIYFLNGSYVVANRFPIYENGKIIGALGKVIFKDIDEFNNVHSKINQQFAYLKKNNNLPQFKYDVNNIIGISPQINDLKESIIKIAPRNSTVLIRGESGTGKELFAHAIHVASHRRNKPFVRVNCAAIPEHLLESELFGYEDGAFTGAKKGGRKGKFELANKGTIFLDEIGDMSFNMQAKLLRVLQEKEVEPIGSNQVINIDVRIIAATNVNLEELIKYNKFREDLFYRLNVVNLNIPSLRERKEDIKLLVNYFTDKYNSSFNLNVQSIQPEVFDLFIRYNWPGNVRELQNVIEQAFNFVEGEVITISHIPRYLLTALSQVKSEKSTEFAASLPPVLLPDLQPDLPPEDGDNSKPINAVSPKEEIFDKQSMVEMMENAEKDMIIKALTESKGNKTKAAQLLGISRPGLYKKMAKHHID